MTPDEPLRIYLREVLGDPEAVEAERMLDALIAAVRAENALSIQMTTDESDWVEHAASLRDLTPVEYVRRAINASLRHEGVDAVLLRQSDDDDPS